MSEILCKKHGMQPVSFASPLVVEKSIDEGAPIDFKLRKLELNLPFERKGVFWVDESFLEHHGISRNVKDEELAFEIYCELKGVCSQCLKKAVENNMP